MLNYLSNFFLLLFQRLMAADEAASKAIIQEVNILVSFTIN